jgi:hypothetical protein
LKERTIERDRETERQKDRKTDRGRDRDKQRQTETDRDRQRQRQRQRQTDRESKRAREKMKSKKVVRERLESYYYVVNGFICIRYDVYDPIDNWNYNTGNYFATKEQAEKYKQKLILTQKYKDFIDEITTYTIFWNNRNQEKYYLKGDHRALHM